jgi:hypothetical protein
MSDANWFYAKNDQQNGPVPFDALVEMARTGQVTGSDLVWSEGMASWQPASSMPGLAAALSAVAGQGDPRAVIPGAVGAGSAGQPYAGQAPMGTIDYRGAAPAGGYAPAGYPGLNYYNPGQSRFEYAGFWLRVLSYIIDAFAIGIPAGILKFIIIRAGMSSGLDVSMTNLFASLFTGGLEWLYFAMMESSVGGATLGKMAVGIRVVDGRPTNRFWPRHRAIFRQNSFRPDPLHRIHDGRLDREAPVSA